MSLFLGIDTSNYTTSLAVINEKGIVVADSRKLLDVKSGQRGLRQSEAVFQHVKNLSLLIEEVFGQIPVNQIKAIGVSIKPRPVKDSYMPVFTVGFSIAQILAKTLGVPLIKTTHQEGHVMAGIWSSGGEFINKFIAIHVSGGTTEILEVSLNNLNPVRFGLEKIGGTNDLHAGQFVDRVGVKMGLSFPAGPQLEKLAQESTNPINLPVSVNDLYVSFSGPESHAQRLLDKGVNHPDIARGVENCIIESMEKLINNVNKDTKSKYYLFVGGVVSNKYIRTQLIKKLPDINLFFAEPNYSKDNAVGVSLIARSKEIKEGI